MNEAGIPADQLQQAFSTFSQASEQLSAVYRELQQQVERLTRELALANGELRRQLMEKEALSQRLALLLEALPGGVVVLDQHEMVVEANPAALHMLGVPLLQFAWQEVAASRLRQASASGEWDLPQTEGPPRRLSIVSSALDAGGSQILLLHDVTEAHALQRQLQRNQRLTAMGEMAAGLAHQLRTPLATALLYTAQLGSPGLPQEARSRFADKATARLRHLEHLIQDMLLFAKGESAGWEEVPVADLLAELRQVMEPHMLNRGIAFSVSDQSARAALLGSREALSGALINLLDNAMQACPAGGKVELAGGIGGGSVLISVRDNGRGIVADVQERLFEPFFTTRADGTGLGLAIVRGVARAHGGSVEVKSSPGAGSEFVLRLPRKPRPAGPHTRNCRHEAFAGTDR